jgi:PAS domain S-box-containing protein
VLAAHAPAGLFYADADGRCLFANRRFHELSGLAPQTLGDPGWLDRLHPAGRERLLEAWRAAACESAPWRGRRRLRLASGSEGLVQLECVALRGSDGEITGFAGSLALVDGGGGGVAATPVGGVDERRVGGGARATVP